jgi:hypothetical protein
MHPAKMAQSIALILLRPITAVTLSSQKKYKIQGCRCIEKKKEKKKKRRRPLFRQVSGPASTCVLLHASVSEVAVIVAFFNAHQGSITLAEYTIEKSRHAQRLQSI